MNSPLSIRARRLLLQKISPNVPVFSENGKLVDVMEIIGKEYDQLMVQDSLDEAYNVHASNHMGEARYK